MLEPQAQLHGSANHQQRICAYGMRIFLDYDKLISQVSRELLLVLLPSQRYLAFFAYTATSEIQRLPC